MIPGTCFICSFPVPPQGFVSLATAEGKYAVHQECRAKIPEAFCDGTLTSERVRRWREQNDREGESRFKTPATDPHVPWWHRRGKAVGKGISWAMGVMANHAGLWGRNGPREHG